MEFCPKCGMRLAPVQKGSGKTVHILLICPKCGYEKHATSKKPTLPKVMEHGAQDKIAVISRDEAKLRTMPIFKTECPKCGNLEAYWWMVQTRGADESPTQFFRCTKCGHTWREMA